MALTTKSDFFPKQRFVFVVQMCVSSEVRNEYINKLMFEINSRQYVSIKPMRRFVTRSEHHPPIHLPRVTRSRRPCLTSFEFRSGLYGSHHSEDAFSRRGWSKKSIFWHKEVKEIASEPDVVCEMLSGPNSGRKLFWDINLTGRHTATGWKFQLASCFNQRKVGGLPTVSAVCLMIPLATASKFNNNIFIIIIGGRRVSLSTSLPSLSHLSRQWRILNISQPYRPPRPVTGIALLFTSSFSKLCINVYSGM
jgi:hypothetical protein